jgi:hypothetical protein
MIAILFAEKNGVYAEIPNVDIWHVGRDASKYPGPYPVIAHPPCQRWGKMAKVNYARWGGEHNRPGNDGGCFASALRSVENFGGVLEHPAQTYAWEEFGLRKPGKNKWSKSGVGWVCEIWQSAYGHRANKATWLYCVNLKGDRPPDMRWDRPRGSHQIGFRDQRGKQRNKPTLTKTEANATPRLFRDSLLGIVQNCGLE